MSRGLGAMQRDIVAAYDATCATVVGPTCAPGVMATWHLRHVVWTSRVARGERVGRGFNDSWSRALRRLIRVGLLVAVDAGGGPPPPYFYHNVRFVRRQTDT